MAPKVNIQSRVQVNLKLLLFGIVGKYWLLFLSLTSEPPTSERRHSEGQSLVISPAIILGALCHAENSSLHLET